MPLRFSDCLETRMLPHHANFGGLRTLLALRLFVLDFRALVQGLVALTFDSTKVHEQIFAAVLRSNETITLLSVKPLHGSGCHAIPRLSPQCYQPDFAVRLTRVQYDTSARGTQMTHGVKISRPSHRHGWPLGDHKKQRTAVPEKTQRGRFVSIVGDCARLLCGP